MEIVAELRCVDKVVPQKNMNKLETVKKYGVQAVLWGLIGKELMNGTNMKKSLQK